MCKYKTPSSWYVRIHNKSLANKDTITIPVGEEEYYIISRKYETVLDDEEYTSYAISNPHVPLWMVERYFYGEKTLENTIATIKMFAWFDCVNAIKQFDISNSVIKQEILLLSYKLYNKELFDYIIEHISDEDAITFLEKHTELFKSLGKITKTLNLIAVINVFNKKILLGKKYLIDVFNIIIKQIETLSRDLEIKYVLKFYANY